MELIMKYIHEFDAWLVPLIIMTCAVFLRMIFVKVVIRKLLKLTTLISNDFADDLIGAFEYPFRFAILASGMYFAVLASPTHLADATWMPNILRSIIIITVFRGLYNMSDVNDGIFRKMIENSRQDIDPGILGLLSNFVRIMILVLGFAMITKEWGFDINGFVTGLGIGGLAFALAAKDSLANIFASLVIVVDKPFSVGDWVQTASVEGVVERISFRSVGIRTFDQALVYVPSSLLAGTTISNYTRMAKRRARFQFGLTYDATREQITKINSELESFLKNHDKIHDEAIIVRFESFGDSTLNVVVQYYTVDVSSESYHEVREEVLLMIMEIVAKHGGSLAFPTRTVYIVNPEDATATSETDTKQ